mgnify:CR=1 FL=1
MQWEEKRDHWNRIVTEAYVSRKPIAHWCAEHNIRTNNFHRWAKKLGYTKDGKRTEKCLALIEDHNETISAPVIPASPQFVEVPAQILGRFTGTAAGPCPVAVPLITIQAGNYQIGVCDGFTEQTLSKVLEVIRYA